MFAESGSIARRPYHRDPYVRVQETIAAVASSIHSNSRVSTRNLAAQLGARSLQRIIHDDLNLFPHKIQITSRINPLDLLCSKDFAKK